MSPSLHDLTTGDDFPGTRVASTGLTDMRRLAREDEAEDLTFAGLIALLVLGIFFGGLAALWWLGF